MRAAQQPMNHALCQALGRKGQASEDEDEVSELDSGSRGRPLRCCVVLRNTGNIEARGATEL